MPQSPGTRRVVEEIRSQPPAPADASSGVVVFHSDVAAAALKSGQACLDLIGNASHPGDVAHGIVTTGQATAADVSELLAGCQAQRLSVLESEFPVSRSLAPGWYDHCSTVYPAGGGSPAQICRAFRVNAVTGFRLDTTTLNFGDLSAGAESAIPGDFDVSTAGHGTIVNTGNTSPVLAVEFSWMRAGTPDTTTYIKGAFAVAVSRRNAAGAVVASDRRADLSGGKDPESPDPFAGATRGVVSGICLEPGEPLRVDFFVTPPADLAPGTYSGKMRVSLASSDQCQPGLGSGEGASGDSDSDPFNNLPGAPVSQDNRHP